MTIGENMEKIKGVNLGSWLVLEKWMVPHLFKDIAAVEEGTLTLNPQTIQMKEILRQHYASFITERDFMKIKCMDLNLVRIPVPHTLFHKDSLVLKYLDYAFQWANAYDIKILIDLHTVPGGQNGFDNSCFFQQISWDQNDNNIVESLEVIRQLIERYGNNAAIFGIEPINEPMNEKMFQFFKGQYHHDAQPIHINTLKKYYLDCYKMIEEKCPHVQLVIHDAFDLLGWNDFMTGYENVVIDTHLYLNFELMDKQEKNLDDYLWVLSHKYKKQLEEAMKYHPIIVGEWSLGNKIKNRVDRDKINEILYLKQRELYEISTGWIFWSYKNYAEDRREWDYELIYQTIIQGEKQ